MTLAMVFPGQGSQSVGMQAELADAWPVVRDTYGEASEVLGYDLWDLVQNDPNGRLGATEVTQPAMLAAGVAAWRVWREAGGPEPVVMAGHSLGEYTALVCADALDFASAIFLVRERGKFMQEACPPGQGAMAAILGLDDEQVIDICEQASAVGVAQAANFNSPGQVVVAGNRAAVAKVIELATAAGARRALDLPVSVPSHSSLMQPAADRLAPLLADAAFEAPQIPVLSSAAVRRYGHGDDIRELLVSQLYSPVQWVRTIQTMVAEGITSVVECGPGKVLAGLSRRIDRNVTVTCIDTPDALQKALDSLA